ncbi:uncharacterized protein [Ambystoma mexicanum]|uniref:uncharacterized protein n=1 Tax=Ambystoma mexicanum TaxID=8296 RepID=UPI0037E96C43
MRTSKLYKNSRASMDKGCYTSSLKRRRSKRTCDTCYACMRKGDCGLCDFCLDKPRFGGHSLKRQKCRQRQCLFLAKRHLVPDWIEDPQAEYLEDDEQRKRKRWKRRVKKLHAKKTRTKTRVRPHQGQASLLPPGTLPQLVLNDKFKRHLVPDWIEDPEAEYLDDDEQWKRKRWKRRVKKLHAKKTRTKTRVRPHQGQASLLPPGTLPQLVLNDKCKERYLQVGDQWITFPDLSIKLWKLEENIKYRALIKEAQGGHPFTLNLNEDWDDDKELEDIKDRCSEAQAGYPVMLNVSDDTFEDEERLDMDKGSAQSRVTQSSPLNREAPLSKAAVEEAREADFLYVSRVTQSSPLNIEDSFTEADVEEAEADFLHVSRVTQSSPLNTEDTFSEADVVEVGDADILNVSTENQSSRLNIEDFLIKDAVGEDEEGVWRPVFENINTYLFVDTIVSNDVKVLDVS